MLFGLVKSLIQTYVRIKPNKKLPVPFKRWSILKGDKVKIRTGSDKGKTGRVTKVFKKINKVIVQGINIKQKTKKVDGKSVRVKQTSPIHVSNVGLYDYVVNKAVRIKYAFHPETGQRLRISKKSGRVLKKPSRSKCKREKRAKFHKPGTKDTGVQLVQEITYQGEDFQAIKRDFQKYIAQKQEREKYLVFKQ